MQLEYVEAEGYWRGRFDAMASPCEILLDTDDPRLARRLAYLARDEAVRIEHKFSRYRDDNIIREINTAGGTPVTVDDETARLLDYAQQCYELSAGMFDITSGVLRTVWRFDGSDRIPTHEAVVKALQRVGWHRVRWERPVFNLPAGMEIDLGGIGKEYAVDCSAQILAKTSDISMLISYGGDLYVSGPRANGDSWVIGVEDPVASGRQSLTQYSLQRGGVATSGDARRFLLKDGVRYGHILDPHTGWPVPDAPRSVTVIASTCVEAGMLATFAMLQGAQANVFLDTQDVPHWCVW